MKRIRSKKHIERVANMNCMFCGAFPCYEPHHIRKGNMCMGKKPGDDMIIPTCHICHDRIHRAGEEKFFGKHGYTIIELKEYAKALWNRYNDKVD